MAQRVSIPRDVLTFFMGEHKRATHLEKDNALVKEELRAEKIVSSNYVFQISKYKEDSTTCAMNEAALRHSLILREQEFVTQEETYQKEINKWKGNTVLATIIAVLATVAAIIF